MAVSWLFRARPIVQIGPLGPTKHKSLPVWTQVELERFPEGLAVGLEQAFRARRRQTTDLEFRRVLRVVETGVWALRRWRESSGKSYVTCARVVGTLQSPYIGHWKRGTENEMRKYILWLGAGSRLDAIAKHPELWLEAPQHLTPRSHLATRAAVNAAEHNPALRTGSVPTRRVETSDDRSFKRTRATVYVGFPEHSSIVTKSYSRNSAEIHFKRNSKILYRLAEASSMLLHERVLRHAASRWWLRVWLRLVSGRGYDGECPGQSHRTRASRWNDRSSESGA